MIEEIILTAFNTGWLPNGNPISLLVVGPSGAGKSKTLLRFSGAGILRTDDLTSKGLYDLLRQDSHGELNFILLGDFNPVLSHKGSVTNLTVASMLSVMSDGTVRIDDGREIKTLAHRPVGFVTACTIDMFKQNMKKWSALGITRRFLTIFYDYSPSTELAGQKAISKSRVTLQQLQPHVIVKPLRCNIAIPSNYRTAIESLSGVLAGHLGHYPLIKKDTETKQWRREIVAGNPTLKFTPQLYLQQLAKGHAILQHRTAVQGEDIEWLQLVLTFTNPSKPGII